MKTDTSEKGLESLIEAGLLALGWLPGASGDYDRGYAVDLAHLSMFLADTQPDVAEGLALAEDGPVRRKFLARLQGEITKRGVVDVVRHGVKHGAYNLDLFYGTPSPGNPGGRGSACSTSRDPPCRRESHWPVTPSAASTRSTSSDMTTPPADSSPPHS